MFVSERVALLRLEARSQRSTAVWCLCVLRAEHLCALSFSLSLSLSVSLSRSLSLSLSLDVYVKVVADELSVPTVGMFTRRPLLFKQPAAFSLATGAAAASPTATVEQEYGGRRRSQEVRAAARRPLSNTLASRSECESGSKHLVCVSSVCEVDMRDCVCVCRYVGFYSVPVISVSVRACTCLRVSAPV